MSEKFREASKASSYLSSGLQKDFPEATVEVILIYKQRTRTERVNVQSIGPVLDGFCKNFPMATVDYHPGNAYGFVAEIKSHGEKTQSTGTRRRGRKDRPRVLVLVTRVNGKDLAVGSQPSPPMPDITGG